MKDSYPMEHTLENALKAKELLIKDGMCEDDFSEATQDDIEVGYILGEPLIIKGEDCISALDCWKDKVFWDKHSDDYVDFMLKQTEDD